MSRKGFMIVLLLIAALLSYLFWPQAETDSKRVTLDVGKPPASLQLDLPDLKQSISTDGTLTVNGMTRPLNSKRVQRLWGLFAGLRAPGNRIREDLSNSDLTAFGIDGRHAIRNGDGQLVIGWGWREGQAAVYASHSKQLMLLDQRQSKKLLKGPGRLDQSGLVQHAKKSTSIIIDGLELSLHNNRNWLASHAPQRPPFDQRVRHLMNIVEALDVELWQGDIPPLAPDWSLNLQQADGSSQTLNFFTAANGIDLQVHLAGSPLPAQPVQSGLAKQLERIRQRMHKDFLYRTDDGALSSGLDRIVINKGSSTWFELIREGGRISQGEASTWFVMYQGNRVRADAKTGGNMHLALAGIEVADVSKRDTPLQAAPQSAESDSVTVILHGVDLPVDGLWFRWNKETVAATTHYGKLQKLPDFLRTLSPESCLDPFLFGMDTARISKLQRVWQKDGYKDIDILTRNAGTWRRQIFKATDSESDEARVQDAKAPVAHNGAEQLVQRLGQIRARRVQFMTDGLFDADPECSITVRIEALPQDKADSARDILDTIQQDRAYFFIQTNRGYLAVDADGLLVYDVASADVEALWAPVGDRLALPMVPQQIVQLRIAANEATPFSLWRQQDGWTIQEHGQSHPADSGEVERFLQVLCSTTIAKRDAEALAFTATDEALLGTVQLTGQGNSDYQNWELFIAKDNTLSIAAPAGLQQDNGGRLHIDQSSQSLLPGARRFWTPERLRQQEEQQP